MKEKKKIDYSLLVLFVALIIFGLLILSSAGVAVGAKDFGDSYYFVKKQIFLGLIPGIVGFLFMVNINYIHWKKYSLILYLLGVILLIVIFIPSIGQNYHTSAKSWLNVFGFSFQPAEAMKLAFILYISAYLSEMGEYLREKNNFLLTLAVSALPIFLIALQPDFGTMLIFCAILFLLLFFAGAKYLHLFVLSVVGLFGLVVLLLSASHSADRFTVFLHPELDPQGKGYHINQAFLAIGSGGIFGLGLGNSIQKFQYLPEVHADSIFAILAEEMGFAITALFLVLLLAIILRSYQVAKNSEDEFGRLVACGIISWWTIQSIMNIGAIVGLLPLTGVPLPFVSHGGSALFINMLALGILLNISRKKQIRES